MAKLKPAPAVSDCRNPQASCARAEGLTVMPTACDAVAMYRPQRGPLARSR